MMIFAAHHAGFDRSRCVWTLMKDNRTINLYRTHLWQSLISKRLHNSNCSSAADLLIPCRSNRSYLDATWHVGIIASDRSAIIRFHMSHFGASAYGRKLRSYFFLYFFLHILSSHNTMCDSCFRCDRDRLQGVLQTKTGDRTLCNDIAAKTRAFCSCRRSHSRYMSQTGERPSPVNTCHFRYEPCTITRYVRYAEI